MTRLSGAKALKGAAVGVLALALLWLIARNAVIGLLAQSAPHVALRFPPRSGVALANSLLVGQPLPDDIVRARVHEALTRAPLSEAPFAAAAGQAWRQGRLPDASTYMRFAEERNRPRPLRGVIGLTMAVQEGKWGEAIDHAKAIRDNPRAEPVITKMLLILAEHPPAKAVLLAKLREDPRWRATFVRDAARAGAPKALVAELQGSGS